MACLMLSSLLHVVGSYKESSFDRFPTHIFAKCDDAVVGAGAKNKNNKRS